MFSFQKKFFYLPDPSTVILRNSMDLKFQEKMFSGLYCLVINEFLISPFHLSIWNRLILSDFFFNFVSLLGIGDKYNVKGLVDLCENELSKSLELNNVINILEAAVKVGAENLKNCSIAFIADNHKSLQNTVEWKTCVEPDSVLLNEILKLKL